MISDRLRDALALGLASALYGASFGAVSAAAGIPSLMVVAMSVLVFAGGSQLVLVGVTIMGGSLATGVAGGLLLNSRFLVYGLAVGSLLEPQENTSRGRSVLRRTIAAHFMMDMTVGAALARNDEREARHAYWLTGVVVFLNWTIGTWVGTLIGLAFENHAALGLDGAFPAAFLGLLIPQLRTKGHRLAAVFGAVIGLALLPVAPAGLPVLAAGLGAVVALVLTEPSEASP